MACLKQRLTPGLELKGIHKGHLCLTKQRARSVWYQRIKQHKATCAFTSMFNDTAELLHRLGLNEWWNRHLLAYDQTQTFHLHTQFSNQKGRKKMHARETTKQEDPLLIWYISDSIMWYQEKKKSILFYPYEPRNHTCSSDTFYIGLLVAPLHCPIKTMYLQNVSFPRALQSCVTKHLKENPLGF